MADENPTGGGSLVPLDLPPHHLPILRDRLTMWLLDTPAPAVKAQMNLVDSHDTGRILTACNGDVNCTMQKCQTVFGSKPDLMEGCMWFLGWFGGSNNPDFTYQKVACPQALTAKSGLSDPG